MCTGQRESIAQWSKYRRVWDKSHLYHRGNTSLSFLGFYSFIMLLLLLYYYYIILYYIILYYIILYYIILYYIYYIILYYIILLLLLLLYYIDKQDQRTHGPASTLAHTSWLSICHVCIWDPRRHDMPCRAIKAMILVEWTTRCGPRMRIGALRSCGGR